MNLTATITANRLAPKIEFVLRQLGPWPEPKKAIDAWAAARPPIDPRDFRVGSQDIARHSLRRAHAWLEKGMMTEAEFKVIERRALKAISPSEERL